MDRDTFRALGHRLVDQIAEQLAAVPDRPVTPHDTPAAVRDALGLNGPLPEEGTDPALLLTTTVRQLFEHSVFNAHPRFFGYITAPPAPIGVLGDFIASALNPNVGSWTLSPAATEIEAQTVRWIAELIRFPSNCGGLLVSGGNMANIVCLVAARAAAATWDVRADGNAGGGARQLVAYASKEAHTWIQKAADICGLGTNAIRWIETDAALRMDVAALGRAIDADLAAGRLPFFVVGTAGSVGTGVVDPLPEIAALCREKQIWFHVDGAYGGFAAALPDAPPELRGLSDAHSVAVDPHKWLYAPLEAGCVLVRDPSALPRAFAYHPAYYHWDEQALNFVDRGPQNSRGFRALKVWLALRQAGASGCRRMIADDIALARAMASAVERHPELELLTQALSITTFRYVPADLRAQVGPTHGSAPTLAGADPHVRSQSGSTHGSAPTPVGADPRVRPLTNDEAVERYLNELNERLLDRLQRGGELFVSNAVINGRYALRACIVNFHTDASDVDAVPGIVVRSGRALDAELRARSSTIV